MNALELRDSLNQHDDAILASRPIIVSIWDKEHEQRLSAELDDTDFEMILDSGLDGNLHISSPNPDEDEDLENADFGIVLFGEEE